MNHLKTMKIRFVFLVLLLAPCARAMQLSDIRTRVREALRVTQDPTPQRYSDAMLNSYINIVQQEVNHDTWAVEASSSITLAASTTYYSLPTLYSGMKRAVFTDANGQTIQLQEYSEKSVIDNTPNYENDQIGSPTRYFTRQSKSGGTAVQISFLPIPTTVTTEKVRIDYLVQPNTLVNDTDIPFNGLLTLTPFHEVIVYGVVVHLQLIEDELDAANAYEQLYTQEEQAMRGGASNMPNFKPSASAGNASR